MERPKKQKVETVAFGGGCFWCVEAVFLMLNGVVAVTPGYAGGRTGNPTYEEVSTGKTGHAEVLLVEFDPSIISFDALLDVFFDSHDPTSVNRQGNDIGTQYRSVLLHTNENQRKAAEKYIGKLTASDMYRKPVVTEIAALDTFYPAEEYHKDYYAKHPDEPYSKAVIRPKVEKIKKKHASLLK